MPRRTPLGAIGEPAGSLLGCRPFRVVWVRLYLHQFYFEVESDRGHGDVGPLAARRKTPYPANFLDSRKRALGESPM
jgi:hypothetical protein